MGFVNLHNHDEYSLLDGMGTAKQYVERANLFRQHSLASTNHGNIDGLIKHQKACEEGGIKPILGCELYVVPDAIVKQKGENRGHMVVLVRNWVGWKALCTLLSKANLEGFYSRPRVSFSWIKSLPPEALDGLVFMTACLHSFVKLPNGLELLGWLKNNAKVFIEIMPWPSQEQVEWNIKCADMSANMGIPLVATNDTHYVLPDDAMAQEVLLAIQRKKKMSDHDRFRFEFDGLHLRSEREMARAFHRQSSLSEPVYRDAMDTTEYISDLCNFTIPKMRINLPETRYEEDCSEKEALLKLLADKLKERPLEWASAQRQLRINEEASLIHEKKFDRYFLVIAEMIDYCRKNGIPVGPGRGSVGGSLLAEVLGITEIDPLKYDLFFSRFINPERNDYPDIDIDIDSRYCDKVRLHLEEEYGLNAIAGVSTFSTMQARGVVRDVGRAYSLPSKEVDEFAKSIDSSKGGGVLEAIMQCSFKDKHPEPFRMAMRLEGQVRANGQHPAAIIVSGDDLLTSGRCVVVERKGTRVINWDMEDSEHVGLIKIDALKLDNLSILGKTLEDVGKETPWDEEMSAPEVYKMLSNGETDGVFQLSGWATKRICSQMGINCFDDIVAAVALSRPGPNDSGMTEDYINRKKGAYYPKNACKQYEDIVEPTYGVLVYQEQVMKVFTDVAGLSPGLADKIRKVIGKKRDPAEFEQYRIQFMEGCVRMRTFSQPEAAKFWDGLLMWASYGFNKSHSVGYALLAYRTAWLKCFYPKQYLAAYLTYGTKEQKKSLINEMVPKLGIKVVTPKIGKSKPIEWVVIDNFLYAPFSETSGIGESDAAKCLSQKPPGKTGGLKGFFPGRKQVQETKERKGTALQILLDEIKAFNPDPDSRPTDMSKYFNFDLPECAFDNSVPCEKEEPKEQTPQNYQQQRRNVTPSVPARVPVRRPTNR